MKMKMKRMVGQLGADPGFILGGGGVCEEI
jgi:hypothetical protein